MNKKDLKKGTVYMWRGIEDGANILFTVKEDASFEYQGSIVIHWSKNTVDIGDEPNGFEINKYHLPNVKQASKKAVKYYNKCAKSGKDVGTYSWHDLNDDFNS